MPGIPLLAVTALLAACDPYRSWPEEGEVFPWVFTPETDLEPWEEVRWETETWDPEDDPEMAGLYLRKALSREGLKWGRRESNPSAD
jgi:hypothetical protein